MNIVYIANIRLRADGAGSVHVFSFCHELARRDILRRLVVPRLSGPIELDSKLEASLNQVPTILRGPLGMLVFDFLVALLLVRLRWKIGRSCVVVRPHALTILQTISARLMGCLLVYEYNGAQELELQSSGLPRLLVWAVALQTRLNGILAHKIIAVTPGLAEHLCARFGVTPEKIVVISNGVNPELFFPMSRDEARARWKLPDTSFIFGFVGSFAPWQGLEHIAQAIAGLPSETRACLVLGGGGRLQGRLEELAASAPRGRIILMDWLEHTEVRELINAFDVGLLLRQWPADLPLGSPLKLFEYLACGVSVLATRVDGIVNLEPGAELINFVEDESVESIQRTINALVQEARRPQTVEELVRLVHEHHTWEQKVGTFVERCLPAS